MKYLLFTVTIFLLFACTKVETTINVNVSEFDNGDPVSDALVQIIQKKIV